MGVTGSTSTAERRLQERIESLRASRSYRTYEQVRAEVLRMKAVEFGQADRPSAYWREELESIEYLLDASPLVVEKFRHHMFHITGIRPYDYRSGADEKRALLAEKLAALREIGGDELLVPEPELLGGFGFVIDGDLFNIDTLKFYEALIALDRARLLAPFRKPPERPIVIEIGAGWGGFAYQLKTLFPNTCYVLVDLPELFLFSGVYLQSAFPHAQVAFWDDERPLALERLVGHDFVFVPHFSFDRFQTPRVDLALNMVSFQEMTTEQVQGYVDRLHALGCPNLYSLNRDRSPYNSELTSVREILASRYRLEEIEILPVAYTKLATRVELEEHRRRKRAKPGSSAAYRHVIGRARGQARSGGRRRLRAALDRR